MIQMLELADKYFQKAIINMFQDLKKWTQFMQVWVICREKKSYHKKD